jgi:hypothetical protein
MRLTMWVLSVLSVLSALSVRKRPTDLRRSLPSKTVRPGSYDQFVIDGDPIREAVQLLRHAVDALLAVELDAADEPALIEMTRDLEREVRRMAAVDHALIAQLDARGAAPTRGYRNTASLLCALLRVDAVEAGRRVHAATQLAPRHGLSGEPLPALLPAVAAASVSGEISPAQARVVMSTVHALPRAAGVDVLDEVERHLVQEARNFAPRELRVLARRIRDHRDPDGRLTDDADRSRRRSLEVQSHADGTVTGHFTTDATCGEALLTFLDASARPQRDESGQRDSRTAGQRRHDALRELLLGRIRGGLPTTAGVSATILLTMTPEQFAGSPQGADRLVRTAHGALLDLDEALRLAGDALVLPIVRDVGGRILGYGRRRRLFNETERLCMVVRDGGCTFPGCTTSPNWCEAAHIRDFAKGGLTLTDNGMLLCGYHHRYYARLGWRPIAIGGVPHWIPPTWIDPEQRPRRNRMHDPGRAP